MQWMADSEFDFEKNCIFLDEAGFNLHMTRTRGWSKKGKPAKAVVPASRGTSITILGAISSQGVIDISLRKPITVAGSKKRKSDGKVIQTTARVGTRTEHYLAYLSNVMDVLDKNDMKGFYLVMDNAPIHKPATVRIFIEKRGYKCCYLPVYLTYVCHKCTSPSKVFKTPFNLRRHLMSPAHSEALPSRPVRGVYTSVTDETNVVVVDDTVNEAVEYYGCPSCWLIHSDLNWMSNHIANSHEPINKNDIAVSTKKDIFHFRPATVKPASKRVKITDEIVSTLSPILTIIQDDLIPDQTNLLSLKLYPTAYNLLVNALKVHLPDLPRFLWTFEHKNNIDRDDAIFVKIIQCVLTDFYSKSQRNPHYQPKYERTFWIDRFIPIFQALGDHSQLLGFQWCEIPTEEHMEFTLDPCTWKRNAANKYHDGMGYDDNNRNRLVMEGSSRYNDKETIEHSKDDAIKIIHTSIELLDSVIRRHIFASFANLCRIKSFSVQCICTTITLSTTALDPENAGSYIHTQVRFADIPIKYDNRASWASVFELLAYLFISLREQEMILDTVINENVGLIHVVDTDRGSNILQIKKQ